jgi:glycosyltransferase involved in cell wall biosynthesis
VRNGSWLPAELRRRGLQPEFVPEGKASAFRLFLKLYRMIKSARIDIVHAHLFEGAIYSAFAARLARIPVVVTLHGQSDMQRAGYKASLRRWLFRRLVNQTVMVSSGLARDLQPQLRIAPPRLHVIYNGLERRGQPAEQTSAKSSDERASDEHPTRPWRLIAIGNIRPAKDYPTLLRALRLLRDRGLEVELSVAGQPDSNGLYEQLLALRHELDLDRYVTFHGFVADPSTLLSSADIFVLASTREGFSLATIEAMLAGVPVIATRSGGPEELICHTDTGMLVPPDSPAAIADAVQQCTTSWPASLAMAQRARSEAKAKYSVDSMLIRYESLYWQAMGH